MRSMTGFGEGRAESPSGAARVALASVNHKGVSLQVRGDLRDLALEEQIRERVRAGLGRGSVQARATARSMIPHAPVVTRPSPVAPGPSPREHPHPPGWSPIDS